MTAVEKENITLATFSKYRLWWQNKRYWKESSWYDHDKYITSSELNKLTTENITARSAQAKLIAKADFDNKLISLNERNNSNETKHVLVENELQKLQAFDSSYLWGKIHFEEDDTQKKLVFQPIHKYFKRIIGIGSGNYIYLWKSKGFSDEDIRPITKSDYSINSKLSYFGNKTRLKFIESSLKQDRMTYTHGKIVNTYIVYGISKHFNKSSYPALENCLFGAVTLPKNADINKYRYLGYSIGFDRKEPFHFIIDLVEM